MAKYWARYRLTERNGLWNAFGIFGGDRSHSYAVRFEAGDDDAALERAESEDMLQDAKICGSWFPCNASLEGIIPRVAA